MALPFGVTPPAVLPARGYFYGYFTMTALTGLNLPSDGRLAPKFAELLKARVVRVVALPNVDLTSWIDEAHGLGIKALLVIARESIADMSFDDAARMYSERYPFIDFVQPGNEPDHVSPSSWTLTPQDLNRLLVAFRAMFPTTTLVGPGLVSSHPEYLNGVALDLVDAIAIHPYGQRPNNAESWDELPGNFGTVDSLLDSYAYHGKRI